MEQVGEAIYTGNTTGGPIEGSEVQNLSSSIPDSDNVKIDDAVRKNTNADISVQPWADREQIVSEHAEGASHGKSSASTSSEFNVVEDEGIGEKVPKIDEVIKTENEDMDTESLIKDAEEKEKEKVKTDESGKDDLDKVNMENLFVEDTSGKKVFEFQVKYNNKEDEFVDLESAAMTEHVNCIVENLISSIGQDSTVDEPCQTIANSNHTRRSRRRGVRLTNAQRQKAYRQRHGAAYRIRERERKRRSYVPAHLRPPEVLEAQRERARIYKRHYDRRRKLTGSGLNTTSLYRSQQSSSSSNDSRMPVEGSFTPEASIVKTSATKPSTKGSSKSVRRANSVGRRRPNKRKQANTVDHTCITEEPKTFNKKMKSCILNSSKLTPMCCNKRKKENQMKRIEKTLPCGTKGKSVLNSFPKSPIPSVPTQVDHKLDLSGINYLELVKLRDACNYYISQYENMFLQQMNLQAALQQNNDFVTENDDYYDSDDVEGENNGGVDDHNDDDDIDLSSDTEDSGYSGKSLKQNVKKTQQVAAASLAKRTQQVSAASLAKRTQQVSAASLVKRTQQMSGDSLVKRTKQESGNNLVKRTQQVSAASLVKRTQLGSCDSLVNRTEQASGDNFVKRSERLKLKRNLKMNQHEMDDTNKEKGRRTITKKQSKLQREKDVDLSKNLPNSSVSSSKTNTNKRNDKGLSTSQQENHTSTLNLSNALHAVVKLEPIDQDDELLNNVLVNLDVSASLDQTRNCRHYNDFGLDKPRSPRAIIQKRYRERKKAKLGALYMEQERLRSKQYYIPAAMMDKNELKKRREKSRLHTRTHRMRKKLHQMLETGNCEGQV